jgi:hypothetical protein
MVAVRLYLRYRSLLPRRRELLERSVEADRVAIFDRSNA